MVHGQLHGPQWPSLHPFVPVLENGLNLQGHLLIQNGGWSSSHHIQMPSKKRKEGKRGRVDICKEPITLLRFLVATFSKFTP